MHNAKNLKESGLGEVDKNGQFHFNCEVIAQGGTAVKKEPSKILPTEQQVTSLFDSGHSADA